MKVFGYLALSLLLIVSQAGAQDNGRWYASAIAGGNWLGDQDIRFDAAGASATDSASFESGFAAGGALGYMFSDRWRAEVELLYRTSNLDEVSLAGVGTFDEGDYSSLSIGLNGYYDFNLVGSDDITTYVGAGLVFLQEIDIDFEAAGAEQSFSSDDFGVQFMFGSRYNLSDGWFVGAELRYLTASDIDMTGEADASGTVQSDYDPISVSAIVGWRF